MPFDFGDVVLVPFPFTSHTAAKKRPAVVVSSQTYNANRPDVVVMAITSQVRPGLGSADISIDRWDVAGLLKASVIKPIFATLEQGLVIRKLGRLEANDAAKLRRAVQGLLG